MVDFSDKVPVRLRNAFRYYRPKSVYGALFAATSLGCCVLLLLLMTNYKEKVVNTPNSIVLEGDYPCDCPSTDGQTELEQMSRSVKSKKVNLLKNIHATDQRLYLIMHNN